MRPKPVPVLMLLVLFALPTAAATIHVPGDQPTIQAGINAALNGDTVLVADGTYTGPGNRDIDFLGKAITVRSADGTDTCIVDGEGLGRGFVLINEEPPEAVLQGFTIRNCVGDFGGGVYCVGSSPTLVGLVIRDCSATSDGGGFYSIEGAPVIRDSRFESNQTGGAGSGAYLRDAGAMEISECMFTNNTGVFTLITSSFGGMIRDSLVESNTGGGIRCFGQVTVAGNTITNNTGDSGISCGSQAMIVDNVITGNVNDSVGGGIDASGYSATIIGNTITKNQGSSGGGIHFDADRGSIHGNVISGNVATYKGGGIGLFTHLQTITLIDNVITGNSAHSFGGGIHSGPDTWATIVNCLVAGNDGKWGGGIACEDSIPRFWNMTVTGNMAEVYGGGLYTYNHAEVSTANSIFWGNHAPFGAQIYISYQWGGISRLNLRYSTVEGGRDGIAVNPGCTLNWWDGMIEDDPLFTAGPLGDHYLSHVQTGHPFTSPCFNSGDPATGAIDGTTRVDERYDVGVTDMGYHYPLSSTDPVPLVIVGLGPEQENPSRIRVFLPEQDTDWIYAYMAFENIRHGTVLGSGDLDGNGGDELLAGPGPNQNNGPHVRGFEAHGTPMPRLSFLAYGTHQYGVNVTAGDLDADGRDEIITGPGPGPVFGPHVRGWNYDEKGPVTAMPGVSFFAYSAPKWGVNVAAGDIDGDGYDEIVTGAGPGPIYGAHVRGWDVDGGAPAAIPQVSFFAYNTARMGVRVSCGDIDGDGMDEIVTAPGPSNHFGAHIRGWNYDGSTLGELSGVNFLAWPANEYRFGASVHAGADLDGDGRCEMVVGPGPDPTATTEVRAFTLEDGTTVLRFSLQAFPDSWTYGASVAAGRF